MNPRKRAVLALWLAFDVWLVLTCTGALEGCGGCPTAYRYDGGATARPYYKIQQCPNQPPRVLCDDVTRLPTDKCK